MSQAASSAAPSKAGQAEVKKKDEPKEEEKPKEEDMDMGGLFDF